MVQKVTESNPGRPFGDWKTLAVSPAVNGNRFRIREG